MVIQLLLDQRWFERKWRQGEEALGPVRVGDETGDVLDHRDIHDGSGGSCFERIGMDYVRVILQIVLDQRWARRQ